jgi:hypothetical protein
MNANFPLFLGVGNAFLIDDETQHIQQELDRKEEIVASLDTEIASTLATRDKLVQRRNEIRRFVVFNVAPAVPEASEILAIISEK